MALAIHARDPAPARVASTPVSRVSAPPATALTTRAHQNDTPDRRYVSASSAG